jgi:hypothetical protein
VLFRSCGLHHGGEFRRQHVRIVQGPGRSVALSKLYPYPELRTAASVS